MSSNIRRTRWRWEVVHPDSVQALQDGQDRLRSMLKPPRSLRAIDAGYATFGEAPTRSEMALPPIGAGNWREHTRPASKR